MSEVVENTSLAPEEVADVAATPAEMPDSHAHLNIREMSPQEAIEKCSYLAEMALKDRPLAESMASYTIDAKNQEAAMQASGMDKQAIKSQKFAAAQKQFQARIAETQKPQAEPAPQTTETQIPKPSAVDIPEAIKTFEPTVESLPQEFPLEAAIALQEATQQPVIVQETPIINTLHVSKSAEQQVEAARVEQPAEAAPAAQPDAPPSIQPIEKTITVTVQPEQSVSSPPETVVVLSNETTEFIELPLDKAPVAEQSTIVPEAPTLEEAPATPLEDNAEVLVVPTLETIKEPFELEVSSIEEQKPFEAAIEPLQDALPPVFTEQLDELSPPDKEAVTPVLQEIATVVQTIAELKTDVETINPQMLEGAQERLETLVITLAEQLHITCDPETIEQITVALIRSNLQPDQLEQLLRQEADLEKDGTHEAKLFRQRAAGTLASDVAHTLTQFLGIFALRHSAAAIEI